MIKREINEASPQLGRMCRERNGGNSLVADHRHLGAANQLLR